MDRNRTRTPAFPLGASLAVAVALIATPGSALLAALAANSALAAAPAARAPRAAIKTRPPPLG